MTSAEFDIHKDNIKKSIAEEVGAGESDIILTKLSSRRKLEEVEISGDFTDLMLPVDVIVQTNDLLLVQNSVRDDDFDTNLEAAISHNTRVFIFVAVVSPPVTA